MCKEKVYSVSHDDFHLVLGLIEEACNGSLKYGDTVSNMGYIRYCGMITTLELLGLIGHAKANSLRDTLDKAFFSH